MYSKICVVGQYCLYKFIKVLSSFPDMCLGFRLELVDEFTKIVPSDFGPFLGHHQGLLACVKIVFDKFIHLFQTETKTLIRKLERILIE